MAPLPWVSLFTLTIFTLLYISTIIFFSMKKTPTTPTKKYKKYFLIKW
uniref:ATP synthase F0 subunit 8 n=1 Tax=Cacopsylla citrisuga TaxID=1535368 RepID=A0A7M1L951_9HEMI|nr:ATP synthase F0 subunit 8 [Cacopsylla citrisuga]QOQ84936.1 ATP synthase F0 subunit 8 [Cacopsylla citrisuga]